MTTIVIKGGTIVDHAGERRGDVLVDSATGVIREVGLSLTGDEVLDATGCFVVPGLVDLHTHLRDPGHEAAETIETGTRAAALGGFTAVMAMPNTDPCTDSGPLVTAMLHRSADALCEVLVSATISLGRQGESLSPMAEMADLGVRLFCDAARGVQDAGFMRRALEYAGSVGAATGLPIVLGQHCEMASLAAGSAMNEGAVATRLGLAGQPAEAEELMIVRDIALARLTGVRVHFQQVSTAGSVAMIRAAKAGGVPVTAEVAPHHFSLTDEACESYDANFKVVPPLRTASDVAAIKEGLADGTIDAIVSGHAPHTPDAKEQAFDEALPGVLGLETALAVSLTELDLPWPTWWRCCPGGLRPSPA
ncbi:MAG: dihydroorotase [Acidimicrobiales bacterium]